METRRPRRRVGEVAGPANRRQGDRTLMVLLSGSTLYPLQLPLAQTRALAAKEETRERGGELGADLDVLTRAGSQMTGKTDAITTCRLRARGQTTARGARQARNALLSLRWIPA